MPFQTTKLIVLISLSFNTILAISLSIITDSIFIRIGSLFYALMSVLLIILINSLPKL